MKKAMWHKIKEKRHVNQTAAVMLLFGMFLLIFLSENMMAKTKNQYQDYVTILYNSENGMPTSESNDIVQSSDGFIWIASYSGLIRYDGDSFERIADSNGVASANTLYIDSKERLWIGTNDNGLMLYELGKYKTYNKADGLASNSVKDIEEDSKGNLYVGTTAGISYVDVKNEKISDITFSEESDSYVDSMCMMKEDQLICVTNNGNVYFIKEGKASPGAIPDVPEDTSFTSVSIDASGIWYLGTSKNIVYACTGTVDHLTVKPMDCGSLENINCVTAVSGDTLWICSDSGVGYVDKNGEVLPMKDYQLNNSVDNMIEDYEGNLWFSSSRQGVFKCTKNYFTDLSKKAELGDLVVNSVIKYKNQTFTATDTGLVILGEDGRTVDNALTKYLVDVRIRCLLVDRKDRLWLCTYGDTGLVCYDGENIKSIGIKQGLNTGKVRSAIEAKDGSIIVGTSNGIYYVKDDKVISSIGTKEGLTNLEILCLYEAENGTLYAGTDGDGIALISDGKVYNTVSEKEGLHSGIVMRMRYDEGLKGFWLITSNSLAFYKNGIVQTIEKFPYSNNYDVYFGTDNTLWVLSSDGLYVVQKDSIFTEDALRYSFYNYNSGMPSTPTSNSFSYIDTKENCLYICGSTGVYSIKMSLDENNTTTKIAIPYITVDEKELWEDGDDIEIPADAKRIQIDAYALSYGLENPLIAYYLDGFEEEKIIVRKSEMSNIIYTNLGGGDYTFHFAVINPNSGNEITSRAITLHKAYHLWEQPWFMPGIMLLFLLVAGTIVYVIIKFRMNHFLILQEEEQKQTLSDALKQAESASMAKGSFLSNMSHEIRTPLNAVIGYLSIAKDSNDNLEKINHCIDNSDIAARHLLQIINNVLDMSSIESGKLKIANDDFDLKKEIGDITTIFYQNSKNKNVRFRTQIEGLTQEWVVGDQLRLNQVLMNLLSNAVKFTPENGNVSLSVKQLNEDDDQVYVQFVVQDSGIGMSEEYMQRLFQPFEQESASTAQKYGGSGLGLSITHNLISMMGGTIQVESKQDAGTTFIVTMHFEKSKKQQEMCMKPFDYSHVRVLVVDDQEEECNYIRSVLKHCGIKADAVTSGAKALKRIKSRKGGDYEYNLCILDWKMPDMDGLEVATRIRQEIDENIPIIVATAYDVSEVEDAYKVGVNKIVSKPLFQSTIFDLLVSAFGKYDPKAGMKKEKIDMSGVRVILAEDNIMNMEIAVTVLEKAGIQVDQAVNGQEAYDLFVNAPKQTYDMILMDVQMPVLGGYEATRKIRNCDHEEAADIPIIAMTANAFAEDVAEALANGMNAHIAKPINYDKLFQLLIKYRYPIDKVGI